MSSSSEEFDYDGSTFEEVKSVTFSGPYTQLPNHRSLGLKTVVQFFNDAARNMHDKRDIRPRYDKLIHSNGICFTGTSLRAQRACAFLGSRSRESTRLAAIGVRSASRGRSIRPSTRPKKSSRATLSR
jgi:hypothetical protein